MFYKKKSPLFPLVLVIFLDMLGIGIIIPIFATLFFDTNTLLFAPGTSIQIRTLVLGCMTALYPLGQFFSAQLLGAWSDRIGRKPVLLIVNKNVVIYFISDDKVENVENSENSNENTVLLRSAKSRKAKKSI